MFCTSASSCPSALCGRRDLRSIVLSLLLCQGSGLIYVGLFLGSQFCSIDLSVLCLIPTVLITAASQKSRGREVSVLPLVQRGLDPRGQLAALLSSSISFNDIYCISSEWYLPDLKGQKLQTLNRHNYYCSILAHPKCIFPKCNRSQPCEVLVCSLCPCI